MHGVSKSFRLGCESFCRRWSNGRFHRLKTQTLGGGAGYSAPAMERAFPATLLVAIAAKESDLGSTEETRDALSNHVADDQDRNQTKEIE